MAYLNRRQEILNYLNEHKTASVEELSRMLFVSEATIRRDLSNMQKLGLVERSHGGAVFMEGADELSIFIRQEKNAKEKVQAVSVALEHLPEFQTVFIDNSSTCLALAERMNFTHKTVVTNGLQIALSIARRNNVNLIIPGGEVRYNSTAVMGSMALNVLRDFRFDLALLSCYAVDGSGCYEPSIDSMQIKKLAIENSKTRLLIFDSTKVNKMAPYLTASLERYDMLISNADDDALSPLRAVHPRVLNK